MVGQVRSMKLIDSWHISVLSPAGTNLCADGGAQVRSMKRARDVRDQLVGLMERVEIDMVSHPEVCNALQLTARAPSRSHNVTI